MPDVITESSFSHTLFGDKFYGHPESRHGVERGRLSEGEAAQGIVLDYLVCPGVFLYGV
jgi:hypothetical protein